MDYQTTRHIFEFRLFTFDFIPIPRLYHLYYKEYNPRIYQV